MNTILIAAVLGSLHDVSSGFAVLPSLNTQEKTVLSDISYQSIHTLLQSIENRIQNLESTINIQYKTSIEGKMEYYGRKIENIEKDITRFEAYTRIEMDKLLENVINKNFKEEITQDRTIRKIDGIYERISYKLNSIEGQVDAAGVKHQNARETILSKLDKIEENLSIRDGDLEAEIADATAAIDDLKTTCTNMEESLTNITRDSLKAIYKNGEKTSKKQFSQAITMYEDATKNVSADVLQLQKTIDITMNQSLIVYSKLNKAKTDLEESMNEYANKITDMYTDLWKKSDTIDNTIKNLVVIANVTRNEQQNGLRALMIQVGRKTTKNLQNDSILDNQKLTELIKKVDSNFENVITAQSLFLESCHRVQMDESQLESQISIVLEKLIDTFENKTVVGPKDIKRIEHLIRSHDSNIKKSFYHITSHLLNLIQKNSDNKDEIVDYIKSQLLHLDALHVIVHQALSTKNSEQDTNILHELQVLQQIINKTQASLDQTGIVNDYIAKVMNSIESKKISNTTKLDVVLEYIKNISIILNSVERKINKSYLNVIFNKYNIDIAAHEFGKQLHKYIHWIAENNNATQEKNLNGTWRDATNVTQALMEILNIKPYETIKHLNSLEEIYINNQLMNTTQYRQSNANTENANETKQAEDYHPVPTDPRIYILNNTITPMQKSNNYSSTNNFIDVISNKSLSHAHNFIERNQEQAVLNGPNYRTKNETDYLPNYTSINASPNENLASNLQSQVHASTNHKDTAVTEGTDTLIDLEQLFQTTEKAAYLQTEEEVLTTDSEPLLVNNLVSTLFGEIKNPD